jgi:translation initiation factor 3 subunit K
MFGNVRHLHNLITMAQPMGLPANSEAIRSVVQHEYFDHRAVPQLEQYLHDQVSSQTYDFEANKALLKLYQFFPDLVQPELVALAAGKAFMALPASDLTALLYIAPEACVQSEPVASLKKACDTLEAAQFAAFWEAVRSGEAAALAAKLPGFEQQARRVITSALAATFQTVNKQSLQKSLGFSSSSELEAYVASRGESAVKLQGEHAVFERNEFNQVQPKKFKESVEFEKVLKVVRLSN